MSKPASTLGNKGSYYLNDENLQLVQKTFETLADKGVDSFSSLVVYLCKNAGIPVDTQLETTCKTLQTTVEEQGKTLEEKSGKLIEAEQSVQVLQKEVAELKAKSEADTELITHAQTGLKKWLDPFAEVAGPDGDPVEILITIFTDLDELLKRWKYEDEHKENKEVPHGELVERAYRIFTSLENKYKAQIDELTKKITSTEPFRLGEQQVIINFDPNVIEAARKCRKYLKEDKRIITDDPSELANWCIKEWLRIYYDHIIHH